MAHSTAWTTGGGGYETVPDGGESKSQGDDRIRNLKVSIRERMVGGGHLWGDADSVNKDGRHAVGADGSSYFQIYKVDKTTYGLRLSDTVLQLNTGYTVQKSTGDVITRRRRGFAFTFDGNLAVSESPLFELPISDTGAETAAAVALRAVLKTPSVGQDIKIDLVRCTVGTNPTDVNMASVLTAVLTLAAGAYRANTTSFVTPTFSPYDTFKIKITQVGTTTVGADLTVMLVFEAPSGTGY